MPETSFFFKAFVDARNKSGHDVGDAISRWELIQLDQKLL